MTSDHPIDTIVNIIFQMHFIVYSFGLYVHQSVGLSVCRFVTSKRCTPVVLTLILSQERQFCTKRLYNNFDSISRATGKLLSKCSTRISRQILVVRFNSHEKLDRCLRTGFSESSSFDIFCQSHLYVLVMDALKRAYGRIICHL